jgi:hypothetical protein
MEMIFFMMFPLLINEHGTGVIDSAAFLLRYFYCLIVATAWQNACAVRLHTALSGMRILGMRIFMQATRATAV